MNLSYLRRMLTRVRVRAVVVGVLVGGAAVAVVVYVRTMCRPGYVPQTDVPLWRGTDLPAPPRAAVRRAAVCGGQPLDDLDRFNPRGPRT